MTFITLFIFSSLFYIVQSNPNTVIDCDCEEDLEIFHSEIIKKFYDEEINPLAYKKPIEKFVNLLSDVITADDFMGFEPRLFNETLESLSNEIIAKATNKNGMTPYELQKILDQYFVKINSHMSSSEYKELACNRTLTSFSETVNRRFKEQVDMGLIEIFIQNVTKETETKCEPLLMKEELDNLIVQINELCISKTITTLLLQQILEECYKNIVEIQVSPKFSELNIENYLKDFVEELYSVVDSNLSPLMYEFNLKPEDFEHFRDEAKEAFLGYANYLVSSMKEKSLKDDENFIGQDDKDILVSFIDANEES